MAAPPAPEAAASEATRHRSLWARLRAGFGIPDLESPLVGRHEDYYTNRPQYLQRIVERGKRYLHFVVEEVEKRGMPLEIALLPMIESAYNPTAYSKAHAAGMWQFIPATGKSYGLQQNWWYDGRRDVLAATRAALDYLQKLHGDFGDWQLALAAYNWGEGAVSRAIERNQRKGLPTDYSSLSMPAETRNYLPKLQAVKNIVAEPERFGMALGDVPNQPYFARVAAPAHMDLKRAAQLAGVPLEEIHSLNPGHNRPVTAAAGSESSLLVPADKADTFEENLKSHDGSLLSWQTYRLGAAESLDAVAARFGTSAALLRQVNGIRGGGRLRAGSTLLVPRSSGSDRRMSDDDAIDVLDFQPPQLLGERRSHRVRRGETLREVAGRYGIDPAELSAWNRLRDGRVRAGQVLRLQPFEPRSAEPDRGRAARRHQTSHDRPSVRERRARHDQVPEPHAARAEPRREREARGRAESRREAVAPRADRRSTARREAGREAGPSRPARAEGRKPERAGRASGDRQARDGRTAKRDNVARR